MSYLCPHPCEGKTEYGYCRYAWCINPLHSNLGTAQQGQGVQKAVITNADRIRAMSDEELAEWVIGIMCRTVKPYMEIREKVLRDNEFLEWLREEATE